MKPQEPIEKTKREAEEGKRLLLELREKASKAIGH